MPNVQTVTTICTMPIVARSPGRSGGCRSRRGRRRAARRRACSSGRGSAGHTRNRAAAHRRPDSQGGWTRLSRLAWGCSAVRRRWRRGRRPGSLSRRRSAAGAGSRGRARRRRRTGRGRGERVRLAAPAPGPAARRGSSGWLRRALFGHQVGPRSPRVSIGSGQAYRAGSPSVGELVRRTAAHDASIGFLVRPGIRRGSRRGSRSRPNSTAQTDDERRVRRSRARIAMAPSTIPASATPPFVASPRVARLRPMMPRTRAMTPSRNGEKEQEDREARRGRR